MCQSQCFLDSKHISSRSAAETNYYHIILRMYCHQSNIVCQSCNYFGAAQVFYVDLLSV